MADVDLQALFAQALEKQGKVTKLTNHTRTAASAAGRAIMQSGVDEHTRKILLDEVEALGYQAYSVGATRQEYPKLLLDETHPAHSQLKALLTVNKKLHQAKEAVEAAKAPLAEHFGLPVENISIGRGGAAILNRGDMGGMQSPSYDNTLTLFKDSETGLRSLGFKSEDLTRERLTRLTHHPVLEGSPIFNTMGIEVPAVVVKPAIQAAPETGSTEPLKTETSAPAANTSEPSHTKPLPINPAVTAGENVITQEAHGAGKIQQLAEAAFSRTELSEMAAYTRDVARYDFLDALAKHQHQTPLDNLSHELRAGIGRQLSSLPIEELRESTHPLHAEYQHWMQSVDTATHASQQAFEAKNALTKQLGISESAEVIMHNYDLQIRHGGEDLRIPRSDFTPEGLKQHADHPLLKDSPIFREAAVTAPEAASGPEAKAAPEKAPEAGSTEPLKTEATKPPVAGETVASTEKALGEAGEAAPKKLGFLGKLSPSHILENIKTNFGSAVPTSHQLLRGAGATAGGAGAAYFGYQAATAYDTDARTGEQTRNWATTVTNSTLAAGSAAAGVAALAVTKGRAG